MPLKNKKIPLRRCIGCREMKTKKELMRIVKSQEGIISVDKTGKKPGRGAYICIDLECYDKALKGKKIEKEFEMAVSPDIYENLKKEITEIAGE